MRVKENTSPSFITVTPGIRFEGALKDDQERVTTPEKAKTMGCDYIVVGRPITLAEDPVAAYHRCLREFIG
jgi:orotidine-5'-phosphate decarboxylase